MKPTSLNNDSNEKVKNMIKTLAVTRVILHENESPSLRDLVGQNRLRSFLPALFSGHDHFGGKAPRVLLKGPSGHGKTTLGKAISKEFNYNFEYIFVNPELTRNDLCEKFYSLKPRTLIFLDEAHNLSDGCQELLFPILDRNVVPIPGEKKPDLTLEHFVAPFSLVLATNYPGAIRKELSNRLHAIYLEEYSKEDLVDLAKSSLQDLASLDSSAMELIINATHGSPRRLKKHLETLRLLNPKTKDLTSHEVREYFSYYNIDDLGLTDWDQKYLFFLFSQPEKTARLGLLCSHLGLDQSFLRGEIEPILHKLGFIVVTGIGRRLSKKGITYCQSKISNSTKAE